MARFGGRPRRVGSYITALHCVAGAGNRDSILTEVVDRQSTGRAAAGAGGKDEASRVVARTRAVKFDQRNTGVTRLACGVDHDRDGHAGQRRGGR